MNAWIISIGNELLIGKTVNTNATWLAKKLTELGIRVERIITVPDDIAVVSEIFKEAINSADVIISTGGLGPTFDDITNIALAKALNRELVINEKAYQEIKDKYSKAGLPLTEERIKMSKMPRGAKSLYNPIGTAPGILVKEKNKVIVALPGVPNEMKAIFNKHVEPIIRKEERQVFLSKSLIVTGLPESTLAPIINKVMNKTEGVYIKSHPKGEELKNPIIEVHITALGKEDVYSEIEKAIKIITEEVKSAGGTVHIW